MNEEQAHFIQEFEQKLKYLNESKDIEEFKEKYWLPFLPTMKTNYQINAKFLSEYPFLINKNFVSPHENRYLLFRPTEEIAYRFDQKNKIVDKLETNSIRETKYFYRDLEKPLLLEAEYNKFNLKFLSDTVRDSQDFAGDNHIYIQYKDMDEFSLLLCYVNFSEICRNNKFVFLIGDEAKTYPWDFKERFGIDYSKMKPTRLRIEEMNRLCCWLPLGGTGVVFGIETLDISARCNHDLPLDNVNSSYPKFLKDFQTKYNTKSIVSYYRKNKLIWVDCLEFVNWMKINESKKKNFTLPELFKAYFIFRFYKDNELTNVELNPRVSPIIVWDPHTYADGALEPLIMNCFPYHMIIGSMRNPLIHTGRQFMRDKEAKYLHIWSPYTAALNMHPELRNKYYSYRFEDLKMYPEETSRAICECLDVPYHDNMIDPAVPVTTIPDVPGLKDLKFVKGFDNAPLNRNIDFTYSEFDKERLKIFFDLLLRYYDYPTFNFEECPMNEQDIAYLLKFPFRIEKSMVERNKNWNANALRQRIYQVMMLCLQFVKEGKVVLPKVIRPVIEKENKESE